MGWINDLEAERDRLKDGAERLLSKWRETLSQLEAMKASGDLTRDWGECSLLNVRAFTRDLSALLGDKEQESGDNENA